MRYTSVAALLPLASAANIDARQSTDLKYEVSDFTASCTPESEYCFYGISIVTSNNPEFSVGCDAMGTSDDGDLPAVSETQCGTYKISVAKPDDGGLVLTVKSDRGRLTGTHTISSDDLTTTTSGGSTVQSYTGDPDFTIDIGGGSSASASATGTAASTATTSSSSSTSSSASSASATAASGASTTDSTTSSSASPTDTSGATRESAFAGVLVAVGLMAFVI